MQRRASWPRAWGLGPALLPREAIERYASNAAPLPAPLADTSAELQCKGCTGSDGGATASSRRLREHMARQADNGSP